MRSLETLLKVMLIFENATMRTLGPSSSNKRKFVAFTVTVPKLLSQNVVLRIVITSYVEAYTLHGQKHSSTQKIIS